MAYKEKINDFYSVISSNYLEYLKLSEFCQKLIIQNPRPIDIKSFNLSSKNRIVSLKHNEITLKLFSPEELLLKAYKLHISSKS